ncbi:MAG: hypothetical protein JSV96_00835 [Candidatus Aminicenantes bacterium]|nr:MAG: hypothetical protein JSV96_00835 [Candidatus Aminicenantes bacterium]
MSKKSLLFFIIFILCLHNGAAEFTCLSEIFLLGRGIKDLDGDKLGENISLQIIIPDIPSAFELSAAADIAARANLESLVVDFSLLKKESEVKNKQTLKNPILIGTNLSWIRELEREKKIRLSSLKHNQGLVTLFTYKNQQGVALVAGSEDALLRTSRSFFLRWPYLWEIWGREEGATYFSLGEDLDKFFKEKGMSPKKITIQSALYDFPPTQSPYDVIKRLRFNSGEINNLTIVIDFPDVKELKNAYKALESLRNQHQRGLRTDILSYSGCAKITFDLRHDGENSQIALPRVGYPRRILTPSYKSPFKPKISKKDFDLLSLFSANGFYSDSDKDNILDNLDASIIIPQNMTTQGATELASRLVLNTAGASFPIVFLDKEIEDKRALVTPIFIGKDNSFNKELVKTGKLKIPSLDKGCGLVKVIPQAFNKSNALAVIAADNTGLEKTLNYLSKAFPYFDEYRDGNPQLSDVHSALEGFLKGEKGSAEAFFNWKLKEIIDEIKDKNFEFFDAELYLPEYNKKFEEHIEKFLKSSLNAENLRIKTLKLKDSKIIFEKEKEFPWEGEEALRLVQEKIKSIPPSSSNLKVSLGVSESPKVREAIKSRIKSLLGQNNITDFEVEVLSAYKQGFFWLLEKVIPSLKGKNINRLNIKFAEARENRNELKRFYTEPCRWLQELYPIDEIISREANIPLNRIGFEMKKDEEPRYEVLAFDEENSLAFRESFSPRTRKALYLRILPEWGEVELTTGWVEISQRGEILADASIKSDLERFWDYYQDEILPSVHSWVMKKTDNEPSFKKQPYFKRLLIEMKFSEPDYKLGLDEEIISSLEAIHDEIYFDTLDFLRGITEVKAEEKDLPEDTSRYSAPGNILPLIHPSLEGERGKAKIKFEDWQSRSPQLVLKWKEKGKKELTKKLNFSSLKTKSFRLPSFIYDGIEKRIKSLFIKMEIEKEADYMTLIDLMDSYRNLLNREVLQPSFSYPKLDSITLNIKHKELEKEETLPVSFKKPVALSIPPSSTKEETIVPTDRIISPEMCLDIVQQLGRFKTINSYVAGRSYENRKIPVLEIFAPLDKYISIARLITFKPTLLVSARQHANEVSSTNYVLKLAEFLAKKPAYQEYLKKVNFALHPLENPDGAALAYRLQELTPFHSLHAGRYSALGIDIGYQINVSRPILPEAKVRKNLYSKWLPDICLNLHGYPSHEWVQQFSNYSPFLFRDYWIPRGWFAYYRSLSLPIFHSWKKAGEALRRFIIDEMKTNERIRSSNKKFYDRYYRWATRWQPHMNNLEIYEGVNLYAKRRSSRESKLSARRRITVVEETPELMDETAHGAWLEFLCQQGLSYLRAHIKYLAQIKHEIARFEEEIRDRIHIQFSRSRPGQSK